MKKSPSRPKAPAAAPARPGLSVKRAALAVAVAALLVGVAAFLLHEKPREMGPFDLSAGPAVAPLEIPVAPTVTDLPKGGVYEGTVVDAKDQPIAGATVLLAANGDKTVAVPDPTNPDPSNPTTIDVMIYGDFETVATATTDARGRFRVAAGDRRVVALFGYERAHAPGILTDSPKERLRPGTELVIRLPDAGWLKGRVTDAQTKAPVGQADVAIYLQSKANQESAGPVPFDSRNAFAKFQTYVSRELGPAVWGIVPQQGDTGLHMGTASDGTFSFGPVMSEVQLDVVVTHPEYKWSDFDPDVFFEKDNVDRKEGEKPLGRKKKLVIPPGETVTRTYELVPGEVVLGRVVTGSGANKRPVEGVEIALEHIAQYAQHPWYRTHSRNARSDADGRFRLAGLSYPPYNLTMTHPSFDKEVFHGVKAGSDDEYVITVAGWLEVTIEGGPATPYGATLWLDPVGGKDDRVPAPLAVRDRAARAEKVKPGTYEAYLVAGNLVSDRVHVVVEEGKPSSATFKMGRGGTIALPVVDKTRLPIDPATVDLEAVATDGGSRGAGRIVTRQGVATATSLLPGRYRARIHAPGYLDVVVDPFDVAAEQTTTLTPVVLHRPGTLRIVGVKDAENRSPGVDVRLSLAEGDGEFVPVRPLAMGLIVVRPGRVRLKAVSDDGRSFEASYDVEDGKVIDVEIRITK